MHFYAKIFPLEYWGLFQGHLYFTSSDKVVFEKSMSVLTILLGYQLKRRKRRKRGVLGNKTIEPIRCQLNASEHFFVSSHLRILKSAQDNTLFQQSFERIIGLFATLSFQDHN